MKKLLFVIYVIWSGNFAMAGVTPTTVSMTGSNATAFGSEGTLGSDGGATFFAHWDENYLYCGFSGGNLTYSSDMYFVGIDVSNATGSSGSISNAAFGAAVNDFYLVYENNDGHYGSPVTNGNAFELWQANGTSSWSFISRTGGNDGSSSQINFSSGEVRFRVSWVSLGVTPSSSQGLGLTFWTNNETNDYVWGSFPTGNPTSTFNGQTTTMTTKLVYNSTGNGVNPSTAGSSQPLGLLLPVELGNFQCVKFPDFANLAWSTYSERNNSHFHIQRSADSRSWEAIGRVEGHGTTLEPQEYGFTDTRPLAGINYYRLEQVDFDGRAEYSKVLSAEFGTSTVRSVTLSPNPAFDELLIGLPPDDGDGYTAQVFDLRGKTWIAKVPVSGGKGLDVGQLPVGVYMVRIESGIGLPMLGRFVKQ